MEGKKEKRGEGIANGDTEEREREESGVELIASAIGRTEGRAASG